MSAAVLLGAWALVAWAYAVNGGGGYSGIAGDFLLLAVALTLGTFVLAVQAWRERLSAAYPVLLAVLAMPSILFLALIDRLGG